MESGTRARPVWLVAVGLALGVWLAGAYLPALSSAWVTLNLLTAAGQPHIVSLPMAYPEVGIDGHTVVSLVGVLFIVGGVTRWATYLTKAATPDSPPAMGLDSGVNAAPRSNYQQSVG